MNAAMTSIARALNNGNKLVLTATSMRTGERGRRYVVEHDGAFRTVWYWGSAVAQYDESKRALCVSLCGWDSMTTRKVVTTACHALGFGISCHRMKGKTFLSPTSTDTIFEPILMGSHTRYIFTKKHDQGVVSYLCSITL
jgi:hypothetical protein